MDVPVSVLSSVILCRSRRGMGCHLKFSGMGRLCGCAGLVLLRAGSRGSPPTPLLLACLADSVPCVSVPSNSTHCLQWGPAYFFLSQLSLIILSLRDIFSHKNPDSFSLPGLSNVPSVQLYFISSLPPSTIFIFHSISLHFTEEKREV